MMYLINILCNNDMHSLQQCSPPDGILTVIDEPLVLITPPPLLSTSNLDSHLDVCTKQLLCHVQRYVPVILIVCCC